ncbi:hypothetical protein HZS_3821 [Henneguya salminicola]|nr:hypothetical protein HZS_3821 [Henneguya salminicola]
MFSFVYLYLTKIINYPHIFVRIYAIFIFIYITKNIMPLLSITGGCVFMMLNYYKIIEKVNAQYIREPTELIGKMSHHQNSSNSYYSRNHDYNQKEIRSRYNEPANLSSFADRSLRNDSASRVIHLGFIHPNARDIEALIEFEHLEAAKKMIGYARNNEIKIRNKPISVRFSTHQSIKTRVESSPNFLKLYESFNIQRAQPVLHAFVDDFSQVTYEDFERVYICFYFKIFFKFGEIKRLLVFNKNHKTHALVEMSTTESAIMAKISLDGQNEFSDSVLFNVDFSKNSELIIDHTGSRCRFGCDYTQREESPDFVEDSTFKRPTTRTRRDEFRTREFSPSPNRERERNFCPQYSNSYIQPYETSQRHRSRSPIEPAGSVVLISNLPNNVFYFSLSKLTCDHLYNFVGYYGDIERIKILFKKQNAALIQMNNAYMADQVIKHLHQLEVDRNFLCVNLSNYDSIKMPARNSENPHLTQDYSNSPYKRYKRLGSRNYRHIYPPSTTLHVSNITHDMTLKDIKDLFSKVAGVNVDNVESLRDIKGQAFVFMNTLTDAIYGLMVCVVFISKSKLFFFKYRRNFTTIFFQIPVNSRFPSRKVKILPLHHINQNIQGVEEQVFHKIFY